MSIISIRQMSPNQSGTITQVKGGGEVGLRIREMGLVPGTIITIVGRAPLQDPVNIKLHSNNLTLRNNEADHILVNISKIAATGEE